MKERTDLPPLLQKASASLEKGGNVPLNPSEMCADSVSLPKVQASASADGGKDSTSRCTEDGKAGVGALCCQGSPGCPDQGEGRWGV